MSEILKVKKRTCLLKVSAFFFLILWDISEDHLKACRVIFALYSWAKKKVQNRPKLLVCLNTEGTTKLLFRNKSVIFLWTKKWDGRGKNVKYFSFLLNHFLSSQSVLRGKGGVGGANKLGVTSLEGVRHLLQYSLHQFKKRGHFRFSGVHLPWAKHKVR